MQAWIDTVLVNLGYLFMIEPTGVHFYILSGVAAACLLIFGKLIANISSSVIILDLFLLKKLEILQFFISIPGLTTIKSKSIEDNL